MTVAIPAQKELIFRIRNKELQAFEELYDRYAQSLLGVILKVVPDTIEAEAKLEKLFELAYSQSDTIHENTINLFPWLFGIAKGLSQQNDITNTLVSNRKTPVWRGAAAF